MRQPTTMLLILLLSGSVTRAEAPQSLFALKSPGTVQERPRPWAEWQSMTGSWKGLRRGLEDIGVKVSAYSNHVYGINLKGGRDTNNAQRYSHTYDLIVQLDLHKMQLVPGGEILMHYQGWLGRHRNINDKVGALGDPFDDADGHKSIYIDQLWYQQSFFARRLQLRFGYLDQQTILDRNAYANSEDKQFANAFLDNNNAIVPLTIGQGISVFVQPAEWLGLVIGAADGEGRPFRDGFDTAYHDGADFFGYFQMGLRLNLESRNGPLPGTYRLGALYDPRTRPLFERPKPDNRPPDQESDDVGFYLSFDQMLYREDDTSSQGLGAFARYGLRHGDLNRIQQFWSAGVQYQGLIEHRDQDVLGCGAYSAHASNQYQRYADSDFSRETGFELYYSIHLTPWLTVVPDVQYIVNPGGSRNASDAIIFGLRARFIL